MPKPRKELVSLAATPYYHCVSRCVRRAFLCGTDQHSGQCFEHRRAWIEELLIQQSRVFAVDIAAYAVMSNHFHVVLHINELRAKNWPNHEVIERWHSLYKGNLITQRYLQGETLIPAELDAVEKYANLWRERLMSVSWFMRRLNESIARKANEEDGCTGHFWEGRFKSQALLDEKALAACMAYVDLNPIRAQMAKTPEKSDFTSVKKRCEKAKSAHNPNHPQQQPKDLQPFAGYVRQNMPEGIPFRLTDYLELVDWTGRQIRSSKKGSMDKNLPPILGRLGINAEKWLNLSQHFGEHFTAWVGNAENLQNSIEHFSQGKVLQRIRGVTACRYLFAA
ncbi:MAG: transposase [Oceanospirillaceae bacterium]|nr:transposase [Oceanospirillaceae bacterium]MCP5335135.1 transposase [Oceanospirillaceae bacterium]